MSDEPPVVACEPSVRVGLGTDRTPRFLVAPEAELGMVLTSPQLGLNNALVPKSNEHRGV
jgi:hypothetical protein